MVLIIYAFVLFLHGAKNRKKRQNCIVYRDEKTCAKNIHLCLSHHDVYEIARLIDSRK